MPANFSEDICKELRENANKIAAVGKGILAADESTGTIGKRFEGIKVENNEENRREYRKLLFTTPGLGKFISGAILYEETLFQEAEKGTSMVSLLNKEAIIPGIKVDVGLTALPGTDNEKATMGLDGLDDRCAKYYKAGARFVKWRAVLEIDRQKDKPSQLSVAETAHTLARYAAISQKNKLVPIVEPEILTDGAHTIEDCALATEKVLAAVFKALSDQHIYLEGCLLKPNMVTPGATCSEKADPSKIAFFTVRTLARTVPPALVGVMFLSGGQSEEEASLNLNAMNAGQKHPWKLSFSYGRALQASVLKTWGGKKEQFKAAQEVLLKRAEANGLAQKGEYKGGVESTGSQYVKGYVY